MGTITQYVILFIVSAGAIPTVALLRFLYRLRRRRHPEPGYEYIYVEEDGSARELRPDEVDYLETKFLPFDGAQPYIKCYYEELTPDHRI